MAAESFLYANLQASGAQSDTDVIAAASGYSYEIHWACVSLSGAGNFQLTVGADAAGTRLMDTSILATTPGIFAPHTGVLMPTNTALKITTNAGNVKVSVLYKKVPI